MTNDVKWFYGDGFSCGDFNSFTVYKYGYNARINKAEGYIAIAYGECNFIII